MQQGYIYVATGEKYIKEAEQSAQTLKKVSPQAHVTLITNEPYTSTIFDGVKVVSYTNDEPENWKKGLVFKVIGFLASPYEKTVFIDSDTYICEDTSDLLGMLDYFDLLICHDYYDKAEVSHEGQTVKGYYPYNTGVVTYRKSEAILAFLELWKKLYLDELDTFWSDQPAFMKALMLSSVRIHVLSSVYNFRFLNNVAFPENEKVKIIHGRCSMDEFKKIETTINQDTAQRVWVANRRKCYTWEEKNWWIKTAKSIYAFLRKILGR
ncbi:MAG: hypothetical protein GY810_14680 [Aureispira sp.]|nr:hypothetical protein [Aureispira sp.]